MKRIAVKAARPAVCGAISGGRRISCPAGQTCVCDGDGLLDAEDYYNCKCKATAAAATVLVGPGK